MPESSNYTLHPVEALTLLEQWKRALNQEKDHGDK